MAQIPRLKAYSGPALLSNGFRPFFLFGPAWAAVQVLVWLPLFLGELSVPTVFAPRDWHVHEMLFGYIAAVMAGFLLTAIPNWTGRLPLQGKPLLALVLAWMAGRAAVTLSSETGWLVALLLDGAFLILLATAITREIVAGKNWRNGKIVGLVVLLAATNVAFHLEAHFKGIAEYSTRFAIAIMVMMILVIGGRIVPSFTRNWLMRQAPGRLPAPFDRFDVASLAISAASLLTWTAHPDGIVAGTLLAGASAATIVRLGRWAGERTANDRLVLILHLGFAFVPLGFALLALAAFQLVPQSAGIHAWTAGAMGTMTLAVMSRATLGHTGCPLQASRALQAIYALVISAATARILAALLPPWTTVLLHIAAFGWMLAFLGFAAHYTPLLTRSTTPGAKLDRHR